ncbi:MAM and LDL-receptor class A domain-containing protein 2-like [Actinia tenebrosa]|uniref:Metalloendopeptidase n=1 Tax=Actinia tenebrosa TaxID=6105 RepID=A0A6P8IPE1_ACTTE|nr:MAM and LDL-receptor class A domain-containing protein 2-like [Actinia tenebrosa]
MMFLFAVTRLVFLAVMIVTVMEARTMYHEQQDEDTIDGKNFKRTLPNIQELTILDKISIINKGHQGKRLFEADIVLTDHDHVDTRNTGDVDGPSGNIVKRNAARSRQGLWQTRVVPYEIDPAISGGQSSILQDAINEFNTHSCLKWIPKRSEDKNWVKFVKGDGCFSSVGKKYWTEGFQVLSLGGGCYSKGTIQHEMLHASGFWHEQSRPDRNQYVEVLWENIEPNMAYNFNKYTHANIDMLNKPYDYDSIMHYGKYGFSINGKPTLQALGDRSRNIGQRNSLSPTDILELNALYDCKTKSGGWSDWSSYSPCDYSCYKYRQRFCTAEHRSNCPEANFYGIQTDMKRCPHEECNAPLDGHWGRWSSWGSCSTTCGEGSKTRTRICDDPVPKNGGKNCVGSNTEQRYCKVRSCGLGPDDCEFDNFCFWTQDKSDTNPHPWALNKGTTPSANTGPKGDHTSGSGSYIFIEASAPAATGNTARLLSKIFPATSGRCMSFWYSMYGGGMGDLNVYLKDPETGAMEKIWSKSGDQGQDWKNAEVTIKRAANYKVVFEAVRGVDFRSDIALDDVTFKDGSCAGLRPTIALPTTKVVPTTSPTKAPISPPADVCNFGTASGTLCTWINDPTNPKTPDNYYQFNWWTHVGPTPTSKTGPSSGHGGSGYYLYIETSSPFQQGMKGRLMSKQYKASSSMCFDFWYFMYGTSVDTLTVYMENSSGRTKLWTRDGNQGNDWFEAKIPLSSNTDFKVTEQDLTFIFYY